MAPSTFHASQTNSPRRWLAEGGTLITAHYWCFPRIERLGELGIFEMALVMSAGAISTLLSSQQYWRHYYTAVSFLGDTSSDTSNHR